MMNTIQDIANAPDQLGRNDTNTAGDASVKGVSAPTSMAPTSSIASSMAPTRLVDVVAKDFDTAFARTSSASTASLNLPSMSISDEAGRSSPSMRSKSGKASSSRCSSPRLQPYGGRSSPFRRRAMSERVDGYQRPRGHSLSDTKGLDLPRFDDMGAAAGDQTKNRQQFHKPEPSHFSPIRSNHQLQRSYSVGAAHRNNEQSAEDALSELFRVALGSTPSLNKGPSLRDRPLPASFFRLKNSQQVPASIAPQAAAPGLPQFPASFGGPTASASFTPTSSYSGMGNGHSFRPEASSFSMPMSSASASDHMSTGADTSGTSDIMVNGSDPNFSQTAEKSPLSRQLEAQFGSQQEDGLGSDGNLDFLGDIAPLLGVELSLLGMDGEGGTEQALFDDLSLQFGTEGGIES